MPEHGNVIYAVSPVDPEGTLALLAEVAGDLPPALVTGATGSPEVLERAGRTLAWKRPYHRYRLTGWDAVPDLPPSIEPLGPDHADELTALYDTEPDAAFFLPSMLDDQSFVGVRHDGILIAAAGTHVASVEHSVAAIGAVYTHPDHRGRGLGAVVTSGVLHRLRGRFETIGLNCADRNEVAQSIYRRLGFERLLGYDECEIVDPVRQPG